ncbi:hypothetical protein R70723_23855 [Paenibacillus sp. FSL R7-0273]|uniref:glycoside hydrolase family 130 protein n=1 Tax=Paenibacillus sp. FSL R7-0273 TaxID=1536772 RepID=UPI0004F64072|nr:hypothetical protein [Paenibacillus sp. FSL R7-0273]AIQ48603.1 hypothetical protein R70723_23855 [Paenibacillus sp. FSL R7-0273]OMF94052.1 hypothetical protein BK144_10715 [Paenibacillus sp. FSL R7-0273]
MKPQFRYLSKPALEPVPGCDWADKMVLNPAIVKDPDSGDIHMLFRATGPWPQKRREGCHDPYPIFLGYAKSTDGGETWDADFTRPALAPALGYEEHELYITDIHGKKVRNYANGCVEDPRIFYLEDELYVTVACRAFPPGPYWLSSQHPPVQTRFEYVPDWIFEGDGKDPFIKTARSNDTVSVLYRLDLDKLKQREYESAFQYVGPLTEGHVSDNRDVFFFPEKMMIAGKQQYLMLHRPMNVLPFEGGEQAGKPSIYLAAAESLEDFASSKATHRLLAQPVFDWEENRIGASWPPISLGNKEWLVSYHAKQDAQVGYTQSFMIVREQEDDFPAVVHRCSERLMFAEREWEMPQDYPTPCLFTTGGIVLGEELIMSYGAADQKVGISWVNFNELVAFIREYGEDGRRTGRP